MTYEADVLLDFAHEMAVYNFFFVLLAHLILFVLAREFDSNTFLDVGWFFSQFLIGFNLFSHYFDKVTFKGWVLIALLFAWMLRGAGFIFFTRAIKRKNDERLAYFAGEKHKTLGYLSQYVGQSFFVFIPGIPIYFMFRKYEVVPTTFYPGCGLALLGIVFALVADLQLYFFQQRQNTYEKEGSGLIKKGEEAKGTYNEGLWSRSRHPNIFFEWVTWIGFALTAQNDLISLCAFLGPICFFFFTNFGSIPFTEKMMKRKRPEWEEHVKRTNRFFIF